MDIHNSQTYCLTSLAFLLCAYAAYKIKNRRLRRFKVRPINRSRKQYGNYNYYLNMKNGDAAQFFKYTRMTVPVFEKLLDMIRLKLQKQVRSDVISPEERLVITLQYLSQGTSMQALAWAFHIGLTTVHKIVHETCVILWDNLKQDYLETPSTPEAWIEIANGFHQRWNFPHCLGALDGKHIHIQAPPKSGSLFFNYKKSFSIILLASCNSSYRFTLVDIGAYGSQSDGGVFRHSAFGQRMETQSLNIPQDSVLRNSNIDCPYFFVADEAFPLKQYIMRPYPGRNLSHKQRIFNYRLSRARQVIENTFGIMVARWRILRTTINAKVDNVDNLVKAVVVLHNYCQTELSVTDFNMYCPPGFVDTDDQQNGDWRSEQTPLQSVGRLSTNTATRSLYRLRDALSDYFVSEAGNVPWQLNIINRGRMFI